MSRGPAGQPAVSVLLPVHAGVAPEHLRAACDSVLAQTRLPDEIVVVHDGHLPRAHIELLDDLSSRHAAVEAVRLSHNFGAGVANQAGLEAASGEWIAKVDADDISLPHRLQRQLDTVTAGTVAVCGSAMLEFVEDPARPVALRRAPETHEAIGRRMRYNNPINHPTALYLRSAALEAGGYPPWRHMQDYGLFARMYAAGVRMMNLAEPLVLFRADTEVTTRRRSRSARSLEVELQRELRSLGIVGDAQMRLNVVWRTGYRMLPTRTVSLINRRILARGMDGSDAPV